jgi:DNA-binding response OmpR family regulator
MGQTPPAADPLSVRTADAHAPLLLLVEDERSLLRAFSHALERAGHRVLAAEDVPSAAAHWARDSDRIALVISDVQMPGPPVEELIRVIGQRSPRPPILLMSGELRGTDERVRALLSSVDAFLPKPLRIDALRAEVERHLRKSTPA